LLVGSSITHLPYWFDQISVTECSVGAADLVDSLMPAQGERPIDPAETRSRRDEHLGILRAEEAVAFVDRLEDLESAFGSG
jgi:hypothetical protein